MGKEQGVSAEGLVWMEGRCSSIAPGGAGKSLHLGSLAMCIPSSELLLFIIILHFAGLAACEWRNWDLNLGIGFQSPH